MIQCQRDSTVKRPILSVLRIAHRRRCGLSKRHQGVSVCIVEHLTGFGSQ
jgi:hypothetical protein